MNATVHGPLVLIVEDEAPVMRFLRTSLVAHGYRVIEAPSGVQALRSASDYTPDVVLLDLGLPDIDGFDVLRELRRWSRAPVIVLSARGQESAKVCALDGGADDYLTKPFGLEELLARLRVALRHATQPETASLEGIFECGPLRVDLTHRRVHCSGEEQHLTPNEYKLLVALVRHAGRVLTHKQLLQEVWGPASTENTQYLRVYMTHLRRKLEPKGTTTRIFATEVGVGYRLQCPEG